ncbi:hypothetical protein [Polaromonas sp. CG_9.11]|uniref:hypothetical protein n=1 Tax=Polaromonas sp. CG_9.11 TaxID=2787730 RepID=UPI00056D6C2F|nr:hypothetical protein [Polaromonas sp. CG_9.11]MBG6077480.1 hypothetical protein [Polaromonas sp. CG_9.11]
MGVALPEGDGPFQVGILQASVGRFFADDNRLSTVQTCMDRWLLVTPLARSQNGGQKIFFNKISRLRILLMREQLSNQE